MSRTIVGILRGGPSSEYDFSLKSGAAILKTLPEDSYDTRDIFIDKTGLWHSRGMPADPVRALSQVDVIFNALHGGAGEDGTVQRILERVGVAYTGPGPEAAFQSFNKIRAREIFEEAGLVIPQGVSLTISDGTTGEMARFVFERFGPPYVVKPPTDGSSHNIRYVTSIIELPDAIGDILDLYGSALVEEFLDGEDASVGIMEDFRGQDIYAFPPSHIISPKNSRHIERSHYVDNSLQHIVPSNFTHAEKDLLIDMARKAHIALNLEHFSKADFVLTRRGPYLLEVDSIPTLHESSALSHMLESVGASVGELGQHVLSLAQSR